MIPTNLKKRPLPAVGSRIHHNSPKHKHTGFPFHWSAKVLAVVDDGNHIHIVCRRWNKYRQSYAYFLIDEYEWEIRGYKTGSLPR